MTPTETELRPLQVLAEAEGESIFVWQKTPFLASSYPSSQKFNGEVCVCVFGRMRS